jgi:hypothetical protein
MTARRLSGALACVLVATTVARADSCEPETIIERKPLEAALTRCEEVARVTTSDDVRYAALCRGATYSFRLAEQVEDRASDWAERGMKLADRARSLRADRVEGHYRYALCLAKYFGENKLAGLRRGDELIAAAKRAAALDERYDGGGPHVILALVYAESPRVVGCGDHDLARKHMARALEIAKDDPGNQLAAARVHHELGEDEKARSIVRNVDPERARDEAARWEVRLELARVKKLLE